MGKDERSLRRGDWSAPIRSPPFSRRRVEAPFSINLSALDREGNPATDPEAGFKGTMQLARGMKGAGDKLWIGQAGGGYGRIETVLSAMLQDENLHLLRCRGHDLATGPDARASKFLKF